MRVIRILLIMALAFFGAIGFQSYRYITNTESPYDEVGIGLNSRMPEPIRKWGCDRLQLTFRNALPPYGCQSPADPNRWM